MYFYGFFYKQLRRGSLFLAHRICQLHQTSIKPFYILKGEGSPRLHIVEQTNALSQEHGDQRKYDLVDEPPVDELLRDICAAFYPYVFWSRFLFCRCEHPGNIVMREYHV